MPNTVIIGSGSCIPERVVTRQHFMNSEFFSDEGERITKPNAEIIQKFIDITEIENRRYLDDGMVNTDLGAVAGKAAIDNAGIDPEMLDYIIYASNFGDVNENGMNNFMPSLSAKVKNKLGIKSRNCITYDMVFGCPGWVEAMILADVLVKAGRAKLILVIGGETLSRVTDPYDRNKMIFSDGAGAAVVKATEETVGIMADCTICDNGPELNYLQNSTSLNKDADQKKLYIRMHGRKIYEYALKYVPDAIKSVIDKAGLQLDDIDKILIHQANAKMDYAIVSRLFKLYGKSEFDHDFSPMTIREYGNSSVATIPTMYDLIAREKLNGHRFKPGSYVVFASVGAGMNINAVVYKMP